MAVSLFLFPNSPPPPYATFYSDYFSALLRTQSSFVAPTQGKLLNYVERVPLGVVAQIIVSQVCEW